MRRMLIVLMVAGLAAAGLWQGASARHHRRAGSAAGQFDYFLLSLSWSPAFCLQSPGAAECGGPRRFGFIVHGLWPQNERGWPEHCGGGEVPDDVIDQISDLMPARGLIIHEWSTHGTCSGLDPSDYFGLVRRAHDGLVLPSAFTHPGNAIEMAPTAVTAAFLQSNPRVPDDGIVTTCSTQGAPRLREVHVCLDRELRPRSCSPDALREACRAASIIVPPIR
jgi:ribonuclease T2